MLKTLYSAECLVKKGTLVKDFINRIKSIPYLLSIIASALFAWGFFINNTTVGIDCLSTDRYLNGLLIGQGRVTSTIVGKLLCLESNNFYFSNLLGITLFAFGIIIISILFEKIYKPKTDFPIIIFSCLYLSFPLLLEYFSFAHCALATGGCTLMLAFSLYLVSSGNNLRTSLILPTILIMFTLSWYEAFLPVYIALTALILVFEIRYRNMSQKSVIQQGIKFAIPLVIGAIAKEAFAATVRTVFSIPVNNAAQTYSYWTFGAKLSDLFAGFLMFWVSKIFCYAPFTILFAAMIAAILLLIFDLKKYKKPILLLLYCIIVSFNIYVYIV